MTTHKTTADARHCQPYRARWGVLTVAQRTEIRRQFPAWKEAELSHFLWSRDARPDAQRSDPSAGRWIGE